MDGWVQLVGVSHMCKHIISLSFPFPLNFKWYLSEKYKTNEEMHENWKHSEGKTIRLKSEV
jgi:hypothetical protein